MKVSAFDFDLPEELIALRPAKPRDQARLLQVSGHGILSDHKVLKLPDLLREGDVLVLNDTRVLPAALKATRLARTHGGGGDVIVEINLHKRMSDDIWRSFARPAKRLKTGDILYFSNELSANIVDKQSGGDIGLEFSLSGGNLDAAIKRSGKPPLPPYIARKRTPDIQDVKDYQTVYAKDDGSVAAPTAGLHFTSQLFELLRKKGVKIERLTLHVGAGTFLPVKSDDTDDHIMHSEWRTITSNTAERINAAKKEGRRVIAVGTTTLRALESAAQGGQLQAQTGETDIFITPGYEFQIVDGLITNFHLPKSTLFMLVSAFCDTNIMQSAYHHAIDKGYRFYSYGDSSLLWRAEL